MRLSILKNSPEELEAAGGSFRFISREGDGHAAATLGEKVTVSFELPRLLGINRAYVEFYGETLLCLDKLYELQWISCRDKDLYEVELDTNELGIGIFFFKLKLECFGRDVYCYPELDTVRFSAYSEKESCFQLSVCDNAYPKPKGSYGGIIYHIFVDRFNRGGDAKIKESGRVVDDWSCGVPEFPAYPGEFFLNNTFFFGTLYGIIEKIDYLCSLGATIIYLSPIFESPSNHKYDTTDYMQVDEMLGGDVALSSLIEAAKKRGISIILDGVFNHTGSDSIYFDKLGRYGKTGAFQSKDSPYFSWFNFYEYPNKYECWWNIDILPRINTLNPECRDYFVGECGVIAKYSSMGVSGFRLDVADELSDDFIERIKGRLVTYNCESLLFGEVWEDASNKIAYGKMKHYYLGRQLDGVMNYPLRTGIIDYLLGRDISSLHYALTDVIRNAPKRIADMQMNLLGSHDTVRILTALADPDTEGLTNKDLAVFRLSDTDRSKAVKRLKMAYTVLSTLPGLPVIFYGDEVGLEGFSDPFNRMPFPWGNEDTEILDLYRRLGAIRAGNPVYREGKFRLIYLSREHLLFSRFENGLSYVTVINNSARPLTIRANAEMVMLIRDKEYKIDRCVSIGAFSSEIIKLPTDKEITFFI